MNVLVIGCGNLGSKLAEMLYHHGHHVSIVDINENSFSKLSDDFDGLTVAGMPMEIDVLKSAGIEGCDAVAVVTSDDNLNITVSQIAKKFFEVENIVTRITDTAREQVFNHFGLKTICQTNISCGAIFSALISNFNERQISFGISTISFSARIVDSILVGRTLDVIPTKNGEIIVGVINENGQVSLNDTHKKIVVNPNDKIIYSRIDD